EQRRPHQQLLLGHGSHPLRSVHGRGQQRQPGVEGGLPEHRRRRPTRGVRRGDEGSTRRRPDALSGAAGRTLDACRLLGEGRYDPPFDPALFDDPRSPTNPNPYFPLAVGDRWEYRSAHEVNTVEIVNETKLISGVGCVVARDLVMRDGDLTEATDDWYA